MNSRLQKIIKPFNTFFSANSSAGIILIACVVISLIIANSSLGDEFHHILETSLGFSLIGHSFFRSIHFWINDGLMAIFFLLVGLEIKRELLEGELSNIKKSSLPMLAALGGMLVPAIIYSSINWGTKGISGWGIPMATDIAFAVAIISLLGKRVPLGLKIFLTALAIVDDLGAIVVIAIFYTEQLAFLYLFYAAIIFGILLLMNRFKVNNYLWYMPLGILLWYCTYRSGIHATISGVLLALTIPTNKSNIISPLEKLEHLLSKPVAFLIMPLFAISNTDILFNTEAIQGLASPIGLGIIIGLVFGKPIGITLFSIIAVKMKVSALPKNCNWTHIIGAGFLGGIGFTMSIFIALLSFKEIEIQSLGKISILAASVLSGIIGYTILKRGKSMEEIDELTTVLEK